MSPERIRNQAYTFTADIWSLGLTLVECALGRYPYTVDKGPVATMLEITDNAPPALPLGYFSGEFADFVAQCLQKDPLSRPKCVRKATPGFPVFVASPSCVLCSGMAE